MNGSFWLNNNGVKNTSFRYFKRIEQLIHDNKWLVGVSVLHVMIDGFSVVLYPLLPLISREYNLNLSKVGVLRTSYSFSASILQFPFSFLFERFSELWILLVGMVWIAIGFIAMGLTGSYLSFLTFSILAALGANFQHPVGSAFVSRVYDEANRGAAIGTLNFSGDMGKMLFPLFIPLVFFLKIKKIT